MRWRGQSPPRLPGRRPSAPATSAAAPSSSRSALGRWAAPAPLHEHPCPAHGALAHPVPHRYRSPHPPSRQRGSCVRRGRQPRAGGRDLPADNGGKVGRQVSAVSARKEEEESERWGKEEEEGREGAGDAAAPTRPAARLPSKWGSAQGAAFGKRAGRGRGRKRGGSSPAQWPPALPPSFLSLSLFSPCPSPGCRIPYRGPKAQGPGGAPGLPSYLQRHLLGSPVGPQAAQELQGALAVAGPLPLADSDVQLGHLRGAGRDMDVVGHDGGR